VAAVSGEKYSSITISAFFGISTPLIGRLFFQNEREITVAIILLNYLIFHAIKVSLI